MKSALVNLLVALGLVMLHGCGKTIPSSINYSTIEGIHARAILPHDDILFLGTNTGAIYKIDASKNYQVDSFERTDKKEIRDLCIFDTLLFAMSSGDSSALLIYDLTTLELLQNIEFNGVFLDGLDANEDYLVMMGDPLNDTLSLYTLKKGATIEKRPNIIALPGEAAFAASGSTVHLINENEWVFVTGGKRSRIIRVNVKNGQNTSSMLPFDSLQTTGPYSLLISDSAWFVAGGDYTQAKQNQGVVYKSTDEGKSWFNYSFGSSGYRSHIFGYKNQLISTGIEGTDVFDKKDNKWKQLSSERGFSGCEWQNLVVISQSEGIIHFYTLDE